MKHLKGNMKHLKEKHEFQFTEPNPDILDTFTAPNVSMRVTLVNKEVTSLCPITGQPDYHTVSVLYIPRKLCLESKSFKLYMGAYRQVGAFSEQLADKICTDIGAVIQPEWISVTVSSASRGGVSIEATKEEVYDDVSAF